MLDIGRIKNPNKNPVAERAVREVEEQILRLEKGSGPISDLTLSIAIAKVNTRIRVNGMSAREVLFQRDQFTNTQLPISDRDLIQAKHEKCYQKPQKL